VAAIGVQMGWMTSDWLVILALALSFSFVLAAPFNHNAHHVFNRFKPQLMRLNTCELHPDQEPENLGDAAYLICGMGNIGRATYRQLKAKYGDNIIGIDYNKPTIEKAQRAGKNVIWGDVTDSNFWQNIDLSHVKMVFLSFSNHASNVNASAELQHIKHPHTKVGAVCEYRDQAIELKHKGVDYVYNFREHIGKEFADEFLDFEK